MLGFVAQPTSCPRPDILFLPAYVFDWSLAKSNQIAISQENGKINGVST